jgi:tocopherol O-methyltransferase
LRISSPERVASYYRDTTAEYEAYGGAALSWNFGIWESGTRSIQAAFERGNEFLLRGIEVGPTTRVLDVGCGAGGLAIWCATRLGCYVTGITICDEHIGIAERNATAAGVADRCEFLCMDMDALTFASGSFDVVTNQETMCCAQDKRRYLREVFRILAPGGTWSGIDYNLRSGRLSNADTNQLRKVIEGFHLPSLIPASRVESHLRAAGFVDLRARDVTALVLPSAELAMRRCYEPLRSARRFPRRRLHSQDRQQEASIRGHYEAGMAYSMGLHTGLFEHTWFRGRKAGPI